MRLLTTTFLTLLWSSALHALIFNSPLTTSLRVTPSEQITGKIILTNDKDTPEIVNLRQVDYRYNCEGESFFEEPATLPRSNASWIELPRRQLTIPPHQTTEVFYAIKVPAKKLPQGSYASTILVEPESFAATHESPAQGNISLNIKIRYAHQIVTTLGEPKALLKVIARAVVKKDDGFYFNVDVANQGDCYLYPKATLKLFDASGKLAKCCELPPCSILPDNSVRFSFIIKELDQKHYTGFLLLDDDQNHLFVEKLAITVS